MRSLLKLLIILCLLLAVIWVGKFAFFTFIQSKFYPMEKSLVQMQAEFPRIQAEMIRLERKLGDNQIPDEFRDEVSEIFPPEVRDFISIDFPSFISESTVILSEYNTLFDRFKWTLSAEEIERCTIQMRNLNSKLSQVTDNAKKKMDSLPEPYRGFFKSEFGGMYNGLKSN
jgi:hypothetical protein